MPGPALLLLASLLAPPGQAQAPPPPPMTVDKIADDFYVVRGEGGNTSVYITDEGVLLVDPKFDRNHSELVAKIASLTGRPIKYIFNTHAHGDHTGGNALLAPAIIVGHATQRDIMLKRKLPGPPQLTYTDELRLTLGGKEAVTRHFGRCHTGGDSFILFPARRVLATGDCITRGTPTAPNPPGSARILIDYDNGGSFEEALKTIEQVLTLDFDTVVPGHGPLGTKADIARWHGGLQRLRTRVITLLREGKGQDAVVDVLLKEFEWDPATVANRAAGLINELKASAQSGAAGAAPTGVARWFTDTPATVPEPSSGPAPRAADGHPDLSGVWWPGGDVAVNVLTVGTSRAPGGPPRKDPASPALYSDLYVPTAAAKARGLGEKDDPALRCVPSVVGPHVSLVNQGYVGQIFQTPKFVLLLTETFHGFKLVPIDGRPHRDDVAPSYRGDSVGRWEGDTLVVDTTNFGGQNWVFDHGNVSFYSDALHVVECYRRLDANTLQIDTTVEDPKLLKQPWNVATHILKLAPFDQIMEVPCSNVETATLMEEAAKDNYGRSQ